MKACPERWAKASTLFIRVPLGLFFLMAGFAKAGDPQSFVELVRSFAILPESLASIYGFVVPYLEILLGAAVILGLWTKWAGLIMSLLLLSFIIATGINPNSAPFNKDIILLGASVSLWLGGSHFWSVDGRRS